MKDLAIKLSMLKDHPFEIPLGQPLNDNTKSPGIRFDTLRCKLTAEFFNEHSLIEEFAPKGTVSLVKEAGIVRALLKLKFSPELSCCKCGTGVRASLELEEHAFFVSRELVSGDSLDCYECNKNELYLDQFILDALYASLPDMPMGQQDLSGNCLQIGCALDLIQASSDIH